MSIMSDVCGAISDAHRHRPIKSFETTEVLLFYLVLVSHSAEHNSILECIHTIEKMEAFKLK